MSVQSIGKHVLLQTAGWTLVVVGLAALVLPGPGLLALFAGVAVLSTQYRWAERRLASVRALALRAAADSVENWWRILLSLTGICLLIALGVYWIVDPPAPSWWPIGERWWLAGGWETGVTLVVSGVVALAMLGYSYRRFRGSRADDDRRQTDHATSERR